MLTPGARPHVMSLREKKVHWWPTLEPSGPRWSVWHGAEHWELAVTDEPESRRRYTLYVSGQIAEEFADWPANWTLEPDDSPGLAAVKADYEYEREKWEKNRDVQPIDEEELESGGS
jgi:hypothetical protein